MFNSIYEIVFKAPLGGEWFYIFGYFLTFYLNDVIYSIIQIIISFIMITEVPNSTNPTEPNTKLIHTEKKSLLKFFKLIK